MRAAVVETIPGTPTIGDVDIDEPGLGEVLLRVEACGVCHSDVHSIHGHIMAFPTPMVLGHEPAGVVEAVGPGVRHVAPGDHVVACLSVFCGRCANCVSGNTPGCTGGDEFARAPETAPRLHRGDELVHQHCGLAGFAEYMLVSQNNVVKIDATMPLDRACLLGCGVLTGFGAVRNTAKVRERSTVAVIGCGGVGLAAIQAARLSYATQIVAVDLDDAKLDLARRCGATDVVNASRDEPVAAVQGLTSGGVDYAFEAIGKVPTAQQALAMTGRHGTTTLVGILDLGDQLTVSGFDLIMSKTLKQSLMGTAPFMADIPMLVEHALAGRLDLDVMVSTERGLDDVPTALAELEAGQVVGRTVIRL